jgi:hypothetical protein
MEAAGSDKTLVSIYQSTWHCIPETVIITQYYDVRFEVSMVVSSGMTVLKQTFAVVTFKI